MGVQVRVWAGRALLRGFWVKGCVPLTASDMRGTLDVETGDRVYCQRKVANMKHSLDCLVSVLLLLLAACSRTTHPTEATPIHPPITIHVTGVVLDADRLPAEVPVTGATVRVEMLRGEPVDPASVHTQTDRNGRFELVIPMKIANYPYWWGNIEVSALGYRHMSILCCTNAPDAQDCHDEMCGAGKNGYFEIGLSRASDPTPRPRADHQ